LRPIVVSSSAGMPLRCQPNFPKVTLSITRWTPFIALRNPSLGTRKKLPPTDRNEKPPARSARWPISFSDEPNNLGDVQRRARSRRAVSDPERFVDECYRRLLGRPADSTGLEYFVGQLEAGMAPAEFVMDLATSPEYKQRILASASPRRRRPDRYRLEIDTSGTSPFWAFEVQDPSDFDWLEAAIIDDGYYEHAGVWSLEPDDDKRIMGDLLASLHPRRALELGCSSGTVLRVLAEHGVEADGVEISRLAYDHAPIDVRAHIHLGDLLDLELPSDYDLVFGLDVFEHLNPNRLSEYLERLRGLVHPGGWLFANIPAFGNDDVFGEVFPVYVAEWRDDIAAKRAFRVLHCDDDGYPMNGHLIWAHTTWWVAQFEMAGFTRQPTVEFELQERYAHHFQAAPARRSFYVFRAGSVTRT
jgi:SAM-dependent methyltransferase